MTKVLQKNAPLKYRNLFKQTAIFLLFFSIFLVSSIFFGRITVGASSTVCVPNSTSLCNPLGAAFDSPTSIPNLIGNVIKGLFSIIGTIALIIFIYGGFVWMTAFGEDQKIKKGWDTMIWAAMGIAVIFGSYLAVDFILKALLGS